jgi:hypothetical protein
MVLAKHQAGTLFIPHVVSACKHRMTKLSAILGAVTSTPISLNGLMSEGSAASYFKLAIARYSSSRPKTLPGIHGLWIGFI